MIFIRCMFCDNILVMPPKFLAGLARDAEGDPSSPIIIYCSHCAVALEEPELKRRILEIQRVWSAP